MHPVFVSTVALTMAASVLADTQPSTEDDILIVRCGTLLAVPGQPARQNATVVIKNGLVDSVQDGFPDLGAGKPSNARVRELDLRDRFVLPGLIDCHVHLTSQYDATVRTRFVTESDEFVAIRSTMYARKTLEAGFTTVRDLGASDPAAIFALRDAINQGITPGPRVIAAGHALSITGGHMDHTLGYRPGLLLDASPEEGVADGPDECIKAVRNQVKGGSDVIKVAATGGVLSASSSGLAQHYFDEELAAIVRTAHSLGKKVAAHAHGTDGINAALKAGVDSIEHGTYLDEQSIGLFKSSGAYYVPTILAGVTVGENAGKPGYYLPMVASKAALVAPRIKDAVRRAHGAGVKIAFGTDTGVSEHGGNAREFALLIECGLTAPEAIVAATIGAADLLGLKSQIGTLEPGKAADFIAVSGDPLQDVRELERVLCVVKGGAVVKNER